MNKTSSTRSGKFLALALIPFLAVAGSLSLAGCDGGGSSAPAGVNTISNANAPAYLPSRVEANTPYGKLTIVDGSRYRFDSTDSRVGSTNGSYVYSPNGITATLRTTPDGGAVQVNQLSNFTVINGVYTSIFVVPPQWLPSPMNQSYTAALGGVAVPYVASENITVNEVNLTDAPAPALLPAGLVATINNGKLIFVDSGHWRNDVTDGTVTTGTYTYVANGNTATLTVHYVDGNTQVSTLSHFTVTDGRYTDAFFTPTSPGVTPGRPAYTWTFSGTPMMFNSPGEGQVN